MITATDTTITTTGDSFGVVVRTGGEISLSGVSVTSSAAGVAAFSAGTVTLNGGSVTTSGVSDTALWADEAGSTITAIGTDISATATGGRGALVDNGGAISLTDVSITSVGIGVHFLGGGEANLTDTSITTSGGSAFGSELSGGSILTMIGGSITTTAGSAHALRSGSGANTVTIESATLSAAQAAGIVVAVGTLDATVVVSTVTGSPDLLQVVSGGVLNLTADASTLNGAAVTAAGSTSNVTLEKGTVWNLTGDSNVTNLTNDSSSILFSPPVGGVFKTLTTVNYVGASTIGLNTYLGTDGSPSDLVVIDGGTATGDTSLAIANAGGPGALTTSNGILVVDTINGGMTAPTAFSLAGPVAAGPYEYSLFRSSVDASNPEAWYLRSTLDCSLDPASPICGTNVPNYRPETSLYTAIPAMALLYGRALLDTLHERVGEEEHLRGRTRRNEPIGGTWGRIVGQHGHQDRDPLGVYGSGPEFGYDLGALQIGQDLYRLEGADGSRDHGGLYGALGALEGDVTHVNRTDAGDDHLKAFSVGGYWTHFGASGWYLDGIVQATRYTAQGESGRLATLKTEGWGVAGSLEAGYPVALADGWAIEPQTQLVYQTIGLDDASDGAATVKFRDADSLALRAGLRLARTWAWGDGPEPRLVTAWLRPSYWHEFEGTPETTFSSATGPVPFLSDIGGDWGEINAGISAELTSSTSLYANASYLSDFEGDAYALSGKVGLRLAW